MNNKNINKWAALNIGFRPTVIQKINPSNIPTVEAYILDFKGNLYGKTLTIEIYEKLRDEKRFASLGELKRQIESDVRKIIRKS